MKRHVVIVLAIASMVLAGTSVGLAGPAQKSSSTLFWLPPSGQSGMLAGSTATLVRNDGGISTTVRTHGLEPGSAYTVWWVVFNSPAGCTPSEPGHEPECGEDDIFRSEAQAAVLYAAGNVVGEDGRAGFGAHLSEGDTSGQIVGTSSGLTNPREAEVHLVLRTHGRAVPGYVDDQVSTFNGGCNGGEPNEGQCKNVQAAGFTT